MTSIPPYSNGRATEPPAPEGPMLRLCASAELQEKGKGFVFEIRHFGLAARAFALRFDGQVVAYVNRCAHVPVELDWMPGEFLDSRQEYILCAVHGAAYTPQDGRCAGGPCGRGRLVPIAVEERDGEVYWQPTRDTRAVPEPGPVA